MEIIGFIGIMFIFGIVGYVLTMMSKPHTTK
jgi:hypothetical protein